MQCPAYLPKELSYCQTCNNESELLATLQQHSLEDAIKFFLCGCEDETWTHQNPDIMKTLFHSLTTKFFTGRLTLENAKLIAEAVKTHFHSLKPLVYYDLTCFVEGNPIPINSLLFAAGSPFFHDLINRQCYALKRSSFELKSATLNTFNLVNEFICTGTVKSLLTITSEELGALLKQAAAWDIKGLSEQSSLALKKYLKPENMQSFLVMAQSQDLKDLKKHCIDFFNTVSPSISLSDEGPNNLGVEILSLNEGPVVYLHALSPVITKITCKKAIASDPLLPSLLSKMPKLQSLDLQESSACKIQLFEAVPNIKELNLSSCDWLNDSVLKSILHLCPKLNILIISKNTQLTYNIWTAFINLNDLQHLDVSYCTQFEDRDIQLMATSCPKIQDLNLEGCNKISDKATSLLSKQLTHLRSLKFE